MKAIYQKPACEIVKIHVESLLNIESLGGDNNVGNQNQLSRESYDDDWDE